MENLELAKKVWELYQSNMDKTAISKKLNINRTEVTHIIKYTTQTLYLDTNQSEELIANLISEKEKLLAELNEYKYSHLDAYRNNQKTGEKITYKRLVQIREQQIKELKEKLEVYESSNITLLGKKIL